MPTNNSTATSERLRAPVAHAPVLLWMTDATGGRASINAGWTHFTGRPPEEEHGEGWTEAVHPDDIERTMASFRTAFAGREPFEVEYRLQAHTGAYRWMLDRGTPRLDADGSFAGFIGSCLDLQDRRATAREQDRALQDERRGRLAAEEHVAAAQRTAARLSQLQRVTASLGACTTEESLHETMVSELLVASGANAIVIAMTEHARGGHPGPVRVLAAHGYDDAVLGRWLNFERAANVPLAATIRDSAPRFLGDRQAIAEQFPAVLGAVEADGRHALASLPLAAGDEVMGALGLSFDEPQDFPDDLRRFLLAIATESAAALDRVVAREAERRTHRRLEFLLEVTRQMAEPRTPADVLACACELAVQQLADLAVAYEVTDSTVAACAVAHADDEVSARLQSTIDSTARSARPDDEVLAAARRGEPVDLVIRPDLALVGPATDAHPGRLHGGRAIPLLVDGATRAVLVLSSTGSDDRHHDEDELISTSFLTRVSIALSVAHRAERERATVAVLQTAVMPSGVPSMVGWDIAARYLPAGRDTLVGGDWYDVTPLAEGRVSIAVGDVSGHGLPAATVMVEARNALRAYAAEHLDPADALARTNTYLHESGTLARSAFVTAVLAVLDASTGEVRWSSAGHPPPVIRSAGGTEVQHGRSGTLLGPFANTHHESRSARLAAGDVLVLYTDGLIERADEPIDLGFERIGRAVAEAVGDADAIAHHLIEQCLGGRERSDDACVLIVRRRS